MEEAVQERRVHRIDADLERLQPVALDHALECEGVSLGRDETVEVRELRRLARTHVGEQDAAPLDHRIGLLPDIGAERRVVRLRGCLQARAVHVEQPAVERAAQAAVLQAAEGEIGAAVWAAALQEPVAPLVVLEYDEALAEQPQRLHRPISVELVDERGRLPVTPHQRSGCGAGPGPRDEVILLRAQHDLPAYLGTLRNALSAWVSSFDDASSRAIRS